MAAARLYNKLSRLLMIINWYSRHAIIRIANRKEIMSALAIRSNIKLGGKFTNSFRLCSDFAPIGCIALRIWVFPANCKVSPEKEMQRPSLL